MKKSKVASGWSEAARARRAEAAKERRKKKPVSFSELQRLNEEQPTLVIEES